MFQLQHDFWSREVLRLQTAPKDERFILADGWFVTYSIELIDNALKRVLMVSKENGRGFDWKDVPEPIRFALESVFDGLVDNVSMRIEQGRGRCYALTRGIEDPEAFMEAEAAREKEKVYTRSLNELREIFRYNKVYRIQGLVRLKPGSFKFKISRAYLLENDVVRTMKGEKVIDVHGVNPSIRVEAGRLLYYNDEGMLGILVDPDKVGDGVEVVKYEEDTAK